MEAVSMLVSAERLLVAIPTVVLYEYLITLEQEIEVVWRRKFTLVSMLLITIRWTMLLEALFLVLPPPPLDTRVAMVLVPILIGYTLTAIFSAVRVFAVMNRNVVLFLVVSTLGLTPVVINSYITAHAGVALPFISSKISVCPAGTDITGPLALMGVIFEAHERLSYSCILSINCSFSITSRAPVVLAESTIIIVTWAKTYNKTKTLMQMNAEISLTQCLLRDGVVFFVAMLLINIAELIILTTKNNVQFAGPLLDILPPILISRFIMDIRRSAVHSGDSENSAPDSEKSASSFTDVAFRGLVSDALDELAQELDYQEFSRSVSEPFVVDIRRASVGSQTTASSWGGHDTVVDEDTYYA